ncbi:MAG: hypothetical protein IPI92_18540 [Gemmatimonadetes bacterium]|nr:hypothetical protein [Gemmatimonadota bacterium]MBK7785106.1 hypothetical protein [Gemmatimonadota bacterium]
MTGPRVGGARPRAPRTGAFLMGAVALACLAGAAPDWPFPIYGLGRAGAAPACQAAGYRAFDFWLGRWRVVAPDGAPAGRSEITPALEGCAVLETFAGGQGRSLSAPDPGTGTWHQDHVDHAGLTLRLLGGPDGQGMRMEDSVRVIRNGPSLRSRFAWRPDGGGTVRQTWWFSTDGGATEQVNFDGRYLPDTTAAPPPPPPATCRERPAYRALDGMLGQWQVWQGGRAVGRATLTATAGDCLIEERFTGSGRHQRYQLLAFLYYDRYIQRWFRVQADVEGHWHRLGGVMHEDVLDLAGLIPDGRGTPIPAVLRWRQPAPDTLRQAWMTGRTAVDPAVEFTWVREAAP